ncbi:MAG: acetyl-CoA carboxylase carboxyltransferase subunit alpha [Planctomycetota bacterium]|nr:acetyl-CoA carboxylase carboxyltransferase subunit alpha [Planctomycetota bacterium]MCZ6816919.1 acetyl-CoA carboxylase carboxyltransferase subunit alpha [Planctomycetota bacterium]
MSRTNGYSGPANDGFLEFERPLAKIEHQIEELEANQSATGRDHSVMIRTVRTELVQARRKLYSKLSAWETVQMARHPKRPLVPDVLGLMVRDFCELHGDRNFKDDRAIITGFGRIANLKCMFIGHNKGKDTKQRLENCFGMAHPEGYRKALAKMKLAEKFGVPVVCLIDTAGAYPGVGAEERGIAQAIAVNLLEMSRLRVPIVCVVVSEGGSGGALGIGVGDRVAILEHAYYSVISPEGCAAILWKSGEYAPDAARSLKFVSRELKRLNLVDEVIKEPLGGAHRDPATMAANIEKYVVENVRELKRLSPETLVKRRYKRLRSLGAFFTHAGSAAPKTPARAERIGAGPSKRAPSPKLAPATRS